MVDRIEVTVTDLEKKHPGKSGYENMYSVAKHVYMDDEDVDTIGFAIDKENLKILRAKIMAILIDELPIKEMGMLILVLVSQLGVTILIRYSGNFIDLESVVSRILKLYDFTKLHNDSYTTRKRTASY
jgi:hypothetical protein